MHNKPGRNRNLPGFAMLCGAVLIFGAVPVPMFGLLLLRCLSICACSSGRSPGRRSSPVSFGAVFGPVGMLSCSCSPCRHRLRARLRSPLPMPSMSRLFCGLPGILPYPSQCALGLRYYCTLTGETGTGIATVLRSVLRSAAVIRSCSHALPMLRKRCAHDLPVAACTRCAGLRYPGSQGQRERQLEMLREKERANLPCPVVRWQSIYGVRHKKSVFGTKNPYWEMKNRKSEMRKPIEK